MAVILTKNMMIIIITEMSDDNCDGDSDINSEMKITISCDLQLGANV